MKLTTYIVEDIHKEYEEMRAILENFDFIKIVGSYISETPYDKALHFITSNQPQLLIIDYLLTQGSTKTGLELFKAINNTYKCFVIFYSRVPEGSNSQSAFINAKFIRKEIDPIVSLDHLSNALELAKMYLVEDKKTELIYYKNGKSYVDNDSITQEEVYCKDLVRLVGNKKQYSYVYFNGESFIERCGPSSKGAGKIVAHILSLEAPDIELHSKRPYIIFNKTYFNQNPKTGEYSLKDSFTSIKRYLF